MKKLFKIGAKCIKRKCINFVDSSCLESLELGFCSTHYNNWCEKQKKLEKKCVICKKPLSIRNLKYCSVQCRQKKTRVIDNDDVLTVINRPEWKVIERMVRNSPLGLLSINSEEDLFDLFQLIYYRCLYQNKKRKAIAEQQICLNFELLYIIPLEKRGLNSLNNILIIPKSQKYSKSQRRITMGVIKKIGARYLGSKEPVMIKKSLISGLKKKYPIINIISVCEKINRFLITNENSTSSYYNLFYPNKSSFSDCRASLYNHLITQLSLPALTGFNELQSFQYVLSETEKKLQNTLELKKHDKFIFLELLTIGCYRFLINNQLYDLFVLHNKLLRFNNSSSDKLNESFCCRFICDNFPYFINLCGNLNFDTKAFDNFYKNYFTKAPKQQDYKDE